MNGPFPGGVRTESPGHERRREARVSAHDVSCNRGKVVDMSSRGMRIVSRSKWREGEMLPLTLQCGAMRVTTPARCIWARREGMFTWVIGVAFMHATDEQRRRVSDIANAHTARRAA